jgi:hypothetical protein
MQHIMNKLAIKKSNSMVNDISGTTHGGDKLQLLTSIKNNVGNFRKLTHLEITYIEEILNNQELVEIIKVYNDCISLIVDTNHEAVVSSYRIAHRSDKSLHLVPVPEKNVHIIDDMIQNDIINANLITIPKSKPSSVRKVVDKSGRLRISPRNSNVYNILKRLY